MGQRDNVLKYAKSQIGVCEPSGDDVYLKWYNKLVGSSLPMNASWCVCFVTWCLRNAGVPTSVFGNTAQCSVALSWAKSKKIWYSRLTGHHPKAGELILFDWDGDKKPDHIGIVTQSGTNSLKTIEGNTKGGATVDGVREKQYSSTSKYIFGYIDLQYSDELDGADVARVSAVQSYLKDVCKLSINIDGAWGPKSKAAMVKAVQTVLNDECGTTLVIDGIWGPQTSAAFGEYKSGCKGKIVYLIQGCLIVNGQSIDMDGSFGPLTQTAVKAFQKQNGLSVDGIVGRKTMGQLVK